MHACTLRLGGRSGGFHLCRGHATPRHATPATPRPDTCTAPLRPLATPTPLRVPLFNCRCAAIRSTVQIEAACNARNPPRARCLRQGRIIFESALRSCRRLLLAPGNSGSAAPGHVPCQCAPRELALTGCCCCVLRAPCNPSRGFPAAAPKYTEKCTQTNDSHALDACNPRRGRHSAWAPRRWHCALDDHPPRTSTGWAAAGAAMMFANDCGVRSLLRRQRTRRMTWTTSRY